MEGKFKSYNFLKYSLIFLAIVLVGDAVVAVVLKSYELLLVLAICLVAGFFGLLQLLALSKQKLIVNEHTFDAWHLPYKGARKAMHTHCGLSFIKNAIVRNKKLYLTNPDGRELEILNLTNPDEICNYILEHINKY